MLTLGEFSTELARVLATVGQDNFEYAVEFADKVRDNDGCVCFVGNGGSAAIASHMAIDWMNKGWFYTREFNNPAALTCLANDYGYRQAFSRQLGLCPEDMLVAISSSGSSDNIIEAVKAAEIQDAYVMALSGFSPDNKLQQSSADVKFHIPSDNYAIVENAHMAILHAMLEALKW